MHEKLCCCCFYWYTNYRTALRYQTVNGVSRARKLSCLHWYREGTSVVWGLLRLSCHSAIGKALDTENLADTTVRVPETARQRKQRIFSRWSVISVCRCDSVWASGVLVGRRVLCRKRGSVAAAACCSWKERIVALLARKDEH